jgi:hypothetical protein
VKVIHRFMLYQHTKRHSPTLIGVSFATSTAGDANKGDLSATLLIP